MLQNNHSHYTGLTSEEVAESRRLHGCNVLSEPEHISLWLRFLEKFSDPLIVILLVAGAMSVAISCYEYMALGNPVTVFFEPVGIFVAIMLATGLAFIFELKADREFAVLNQVSDDELVMVYRDGALCQLPRKEIVVGDVVRIDSGAEVPADGELVEAMMLTVDESTLTGEPLCAKTTDEALFDSEATFASNKVMRGTKVMEGHGVMKVEAVGDATESGKVYEAVHIDDSVKTPLNEQLDRLGNLITKASYAVSALVVVGRLIMFFVHYDFEWIAFLGYLLNTIMIAVTLIVVAVPEGLPMAVTLSLAYSMRRMLKTNNLVRRMHACETMGATTVICTDKTGTLTQNQMQVSDAALYGGSDVMQLVCEGIAVNSTAELRSVGDAKYEVIGNPTEGALLLWLADKGQDYRQLRQAVEIEQELPFSTERKLMATVVKRQDGSRVLYMKGAPEIIYKYCTRATDDTPQSETMALLQRYQQQAMRTLGFAYALLKEGDAPIANGNIVADNLLFLGVVAISDPVRSDVAAAIASCLNAGIAVKIVTGDTVGTAREIGRQIGLWQESDGDNAVITGQEFAALSDKQLEERIMQLKIIARARPMDKRRLVEALQRCGQVVAVTGDGTNDAPALKSAHVGLSMGDGTSVAKEASDITIIDNSFNSICRAVMWGRSLYRNIQRFILFQMTVNVAACLVVLIGAFMGTEVPLTVTQMLWVNLIMDTFAAMALASLPPTSAVMAEAPRNRTDFIINKAMAWRIVGVGCCFAVLLLVLLYYFETGGWSLREQSIFFTVFVMLQFWNMFNARAFATGQSALRLRGCRGFLIISAVIFVGQLLIVNFGGAMFNVVPLSLRDWVLIVGCTSTVLWIGEFARMKKSRKTI